MFKLLLVFVVSALASFLITPSVKKIAFKVNAIDVPNDERRVHKTPIPRLGGLAIFLPFLAISLVYYGGSKQIQGMLIGGSLIVVMGILDDINELRPRYKLIIQIIAAVVLILHDVKITNISIPFSAGDSSMSIGYLSIPITILWVVGVTNAVNLIDGLDGLACGISLISALTLFSISVLSHRYVAIYLTVILAGNCLGFLYYNFNPASIFMGDTGSQFLGFILAAISTQAAIKSATTVGVVIPVLALGLPIFDTFFSMVRRKLNKRPIMEADRGHLHHKLLDRGITHSRTVFIMYGISILMGALSVLAALLPTKQSYILFFMVCFIGSYLGNRIGVFHVKK